MKKFWLACTMIIAMGVSSCVDSDKDLYQEDPGTGTNHCPGEVIREQ